MFLSADKIHDGQKWLPDKSVLEVDSYGKIIALHQGLVLENVQHYEGIICPGFVNVHCHIELSHLKGRIEEHTGLTSFLQQVMQQRYGFSEERRSLARKNAIQEMLENGIVAVGDIANSADTLLIREEDKLHIHTFIEAIGFVAEKAQNSFEYANQLLVQFAAQKSGSKHLRQSIVPHAPYSVSRALFGHIDRQNANALLSIHNQESEAENELYQTKSGDFVPFLQGLGIQIDSFEATGKSSLPSYGNWISKEHPLVLVHNTFSSQEDIEWAENHFEHLFWCLCPNANKYIEDKLPDIDLLQKYAGNICIGTDSLASNQQLSVMAELQTIHQYYPAMEWEILLRWATFNGAAALQMQETIGSIEPGKQPGLVWIKNDNSTQRLY